MRTFIHKSELAAFTAVCSTQGLHLASLVLPSDPTIVEVSIRQMDGEELTPDYAFLIGRQVEAHELNAKMYQSFLQ